VNPRRFALLPRKIKVILWGSFRPEANPTRQLTGLRPKPELQPKRQRPKQQRQHPKQRS
jgi:hypothetical protein